MNKEGKLGPFTCSLNEYRAANPLCPLFQYGENMQEEVKKNSNDDKEGVDKIESSMSPLADEGNDSEITLFCRNLQVLADDFIEKHRSKCKRINIIVTVQEI
jgi:hypothetical protein